jgi:undecaprenyl-diphosphatase
VVYALILGIIQGLTEFLPVSSSAHLVFAGYFLKTNAQNVTYDAFLHFGTLVAVVVFFHKKIWQIIKSFFVWKDKENLRLGLFIILATIPAAVVGLVAEKPVKQAFESPFYAALFLAATGLILFFTRFIQEKERQIRWSDALIIGLAQAVALFPGISRSGVTIATALYLGLKREDAFQFSFLLSIPAIFGANLLALKDAKLTGLSVPSALIGILFAFGFGLLAIFLVKKLLVRRQFYLFGFYCVIASIAVLLALRYYH